MTIQQIQTAIDSKANDPRQLINMIADYLQDNQGGESSGSSSYLVYTANLTDQVSTNAPVFSVQENTIGAIVWSRDSLGYYLGTLSGAFPAGKTWAIISGAGATDPKVVQILRESNNTIAIYCYADDTLGSQADIGVSGAIIPIEIRVYP